MTDRVLYLWSLLVGSMKVHAYETRRLLIMAMFMAFQNSMFFVLWVILFGNVKEVGGWHLSDVARMFGIVSMSVGISLFFFSGIRTIPRRIIDGSLDHYLIKPRHPLPLILFSHSNPASLGDIIFAPLLWFWLGDVHGRQWVALFCVSSMSAIVFLSVTTIFYCIPFWLKGSLRFPDQLFEMQIIAATNVVHGQPFLIKAILFSIVPVGYVSMLPTTFVSDFDSSSMIAMTAACILYSSIAFFVLKAGIRKYKAS